MKKFKEKLGEVKCTGRGFERVEFKDRSNILCRLQASSLAEYEKPGISREDAVNEIQCTPVKSVMALSDSTSPVERLLRWRREHPEEFRARKSAGMRASAKAVASFKMVSLKYKKKRLANRAKNPRAAKGTANALALIWSLRDPSGRLYEVRNLAEFVRCNSHLFKSHETRWTQRGNGIICLAYSGLESLRPYRRDGKLRRRVEGSWHGWTWISEVNKLPKK